MSFFRSLYRSFANAGRGILIAFRTERSFRIQTLAGGGIILLMLLLPFTALERVILLLGVGSVLVLELLNSMVERLVDLVKPRLHGYVRDIKDLMAAAVLVASVVAAAVGIIIIFPHLATFFSRV
jgi:diacylglycerol kinase